MYICLFIRTFILTNDHELINFDRNLEFELEVFEECFEDLNL